MPNAVDIRGLFRTIVDFAKSKTIQISTAPCDGFVLKMHYRWTFFIFLGGFFSVWYSWYHREVITCVSHFNAENQVRLDYINICLSYPFIDNKDDTRRYLLYYRWIHWTFLLLAGVFYIPRKLSKQWENPKFKTLLEKLAVHAGKTDEPAEKFLVDVTAKYISLNLHTNNGLYFKFLFANITALAVDIISLTFLDFILQNRFMGYGYLAYPYTRDPRAFTDYMSVTFPPFATCELNEANQLTARRDETLGCHLTFMELYEKIFLFLWFWLIILIISTSLYICFILSLNLSFIHPLVLRTAKPALYQVHMKRTILQVSRVCKVGDIYLLYRLKQYFSHARFYELIRRITDPRENLEFPTLQKNEKVQSELSLSSSDDSIRKRRSPATAPLLGSTEKQKPDNVVIPMKI